MCVCVCVCVCVCACVCVCIIIYYHNKCFLLIAIRDINSTDFTPKVIVNLSLLTAGNKNRMCLEYSRVRLDKEKCKEEGRIDSLFLYVLWN